MSTRTTYPTEFKDKLCMEVNAYQSEHKCTIRQAFEAIAQSHNISKHTMRFWYYDHGANSVNKQRTKIAAIAVSKSHSNKDLRTFINSLNPFKRFLACIIGLDKFLDNE